MSEKLVKLVRKLSSATRVPEQDIVNSIERTIDLRIATEEEIEKIINKIID
ncbi:hypothetical protein [Clostridium magnum]|uniref:Uncharacterized protein n=1 Tax=Clostridium magnum DSM 2767 TaxID=1121326 RepID=A0A162RTR2_9CLOT|nr:hypothetical protein [Clostridium magnum]KZL90364.1 hypothetical protein CLMAG_41350 [Clostridium magnum DSM 2767]SHH83180.1 hypothetical protein SAMN02745944_01514 [Clostridium magnum DSM 2767]